MAVRTKAVVRDVTIPELKLGDQLLSEVVGYKGRVLLHQGTRITARHLSWLRKQLEAQPPRLAARRYQTKVKAPGRICAEDGTVLVKPGELITEEKLAPLLKEGFQMFPGGDGETKVYTKPTVWPKDQPYRIDQFNPAVRVEGIVYVDDKDQELADPRSKAGMTVGAGGKGK